MAARKTTKIKTMTPYSQNTPKYTKLIFPIYIPNRHEN